MPSRPKVPCPPLKNVIIQPQARGRPCRTRGSSRPCRTPRCCVRPCAPSWSCRHAARGSADGGGVTGEGGVRPGGPGGARVRVWAQCGCVGPRGRRENAGADARMSRWALLYRLQRPCTSGRTPSMTVPGVRTFFPSMSGRKVCMCRLEWVLLRPPRAASSAGAASSCPLRAVWQPRCGVRRADRRGNTHREARCARGYAVWPRGRASSSSFGACRTHSASTRQGLQGRVPAM